MALHIRREIATDAIAVFHRKNMNNTVKSLLPYTRKPLNRSIDYIKIKTSKVGYLMLT